MNLFLLFPHKYRIKAKSRILYDDNDLYKNLFSTLKETSSLVYDLTVGSHLFYTIQWVVGQNITNFDL